MSESVKISSLEIENVKRIRAVSIVPTDSGLTVIGGKNNQGKTSVLDSIAWALGGDKFKPSSAVREGSNIPPKISVTLSNGIIVERKGKNSDLKVTDPTGRRAGQQLLNSFISQLALDLPKFMNGSAKEKADSLLQVIGVGDKLYKLEDEEARLYNERHAIGQIADRKTKFADEMSIYTDVPEEPVSASELIRKQQEILARNGENQRKRDQLSAIEASVSKWQDEVYRLELKMQEAQVALQKAQADYDTASKSVRQLQDESTEELENSIRDIEELNRRVRANLDREKAYEDAKTYQEQYDQLTDTIEKIRKEKYDLLHGAPLPLPELSVEDKELTYRGHKWDGLSGSEQLRVATAIVRKLNPNCGFVLLDKLEQMDNDTLKEFCEWLRSEGLQAIATRVSTGDECSLIIEDGYVVENNLTPAAENKPLKTWKAGEF